VTPRIGTGPASGLLRVHHVFVKEPLFLRLTAPLHRGQASRDVPAIDSGESLDQGEPLTIDELLHDPERLAVEPRRRDTPVDPCSIDLGWADRFLIREGSEPGSGTRNRVHG
jgi:hypothetical protein